MAETKVLVVCLGNICRSPMGEAVLRSVAKSRGLDIEVDSCGTGAYHVGEDPDSRTVSTCKKHKIPISHAARKLQPEDYTKFTHILAADENNLWDIERRKPKGATATIRLWGSYLDGQPIQDASQCTDPYYGGTTGFETVYQQCVELSDAFLNEVCPS